MYAALLHTHNLTRWIVLIAALVALVWALQAWLGGRPFEKRHRIANLVFVASMDVQLLIGIALYAVSPLVQIALSDMGAAMGISELRYFAVEHLSIMLVAVALAHVGGALSRLDDRPARRHPVGPRAAPGPLTPAAAAPMGSDPAWEARGPCSEEGGRPWEETSIHALSLRMPTDGILTRPLTPAASA